LLDSRAVLHEWHGAVNNPARPPHQTGQAADFASDSKWINEQRLASSAAKGRRHLGFVPFWGNRRAQL